MATHNRTDRERVLMAIAVQTAGTVHDQMKRMASGWQLRFTFDRPAAQFIPIEMAEIIGMPMQPGDIVRCKTNFNHPWGISELAERRGYSDFLLKEIGGESLCKMGNESLDVLRFIPPHLLYTGAKRRVFQWASGKAFASRFNPDADLYKRCGGVDVDGDYLTIWSRAHIFAMEKRPKDGPVLYAQPRKFTLKWGKQTKLRDIVDAMRHQGFAEDFEYREEKPDEGQGGYAKITQSDLLKTLESAGFHLK